MQDRWYKQAIVYCLDVETFQDSDGDGIGDLPGLTSRLDYLARLGVTCLWLNPIHPSPDRDDGYDVADYYNVNPRIGTLGDFVELVHQADNRGLRVIVDLVVNHTSNEHPWFQEARSDPRSPRRNWYVWSDERPSNRTQGVVFPGVQKETWTHDAKAKAWYFHRFYDFQPDLNSDNPEVRAEVRKIMAFWLRPGVAGFRMDAAPFVIESTRPNEAQAGKDFEYLAELPILSGGDFGYERVNVVSQRADPGSLLSWMGRMLHTVRECPEFGVGQASPLDSGDPSVLALRHEAPTGVMLSLVNLADEPHRVDVGPQPGEDEDRLEVFANRDYGPVDPGLQNLELDGYGYRWIRLARGSG